MKLSESHLKEIIRQEVEYRLIESVLDNLIVEELKKMGINEEDEGFDDYKTQSRRDFLKKLRNWGLGAMAVGAVGLPLGLAQKDAADERSAQMDQRRKEAFAERSSREYKEQELLEYLNNTAAFRWGRGNQSMMQVPDQDERTGILPVSYTIALEALKNKRSGGPVFPPPDEQVAFTQGDGASAKRNLESFFDDFSEEDFIDYSYAFETGGITRVPGGGLEKRMLMVSPGSISPDYVLPENGLTAREYYNWVYYNQFLSMDEVMEARNYDIEMAEDDGEYMKMEDLFTEATPGAWKELLK
tara:strand:- start:237 stop:1136 length:900 start_codon:yes stop_codon:yes gene_type:complete